MPANSPAISATSPSKARPGARPLRLRSSGVLSILYAAPRCSPILRMALWMIAASSGVAGRMVSGGFITMHYHPGSALYGAPLCPAGHLPHLGGDRLVADVAAANLPTCGGDVRQDRGGRRRTPRSIAALSRSPADRARAPPPRLRRRGSTRFRRPVRASRSAAGRPLCNHPARRRRHGGNRRSARARRRDRARAGRSLPQAAAFPSSRGRRRTPVPSAAPCRARRR